MLVEELAVGVDDVLIWAARVSGFFHLDLADYWLCRGRRLTEVEVLQDVRVAILALGARALGGCVLLAEGQAGCRDDRARDLPGAALVEGVGFATGAVSSQSQLRLTSAMTSASLT